MPRVPTQAPQISTDVSVGPALEPVGQQGVISEAISRTGGQASAIALDLMGKLKQVENSDAVYKAQTDDLLWYQQTEALIKNGDRFSDGYVKDEQGKYVEVPDVSSTTGFRKQTTSEYFTEQANQRFKENQEKMPSYVAQQQYKQAQHGWYLDKVGSVWGMEQSARYEHSKADLSLDVQKLTDQFIGTPSIHLAKLYEATDTVVQRVQKNVQAGLYGKLKGEEMMRDHLSSMIFGNFQGQLDIVQERIRGAGADIKAGREPLFNVQDERIRLLEQLDGVDPESMKRGSSYKAGSMLTPAQQIQIRNEINSLVAKTPEEKKLRKEPYNDWLNSAKGDLESRQKGAKFSVLAPKALRYAKDLIAQETMDWNQAANDVAELAASDATGKMDTRSFALLPELQQRAMIQQGYKIIDAAMEEIRKQVPPNAKYMDSLGGNAKKIFKSQMESKIDAQVSQNTRNTADLIINADKGPSALRKRFEDLNPDSPKTLASPAFWDAMDRLEHDANVKNPGNKANVRLLPDQGDFADRLAKSLTQGDPQEIVDGLVGLAKNRPERYKKVLAELLATKKVGPEIQFVTRLYSQSPVLAKEFATMLNPLSKDEEDNFNSRMVAEGGSAKDFRDKVLQNKDFQRYLAAMDTETRGVGPREAMRKATTDFYVRKAQRIYLSPFSPGGAKKSGEAAQKALISNHLNIFTIKKKDGESYLMRVSKQLQDGSQVLESDEKIFQVFYNNYFTKESLAKLNPDPPPGWDRTKLSRERLPEKVASDGFLIPDPEDPELLNVEFKNPFDNSPQRVTVDGKLLRIPIKAIQKSRGEYDPNLWENIKGVFGAQVPGKAP